MPRDARSGTAIVNVETVTTSDRSLLHAVRATLAVADEAFLCVAFVQEKGLHLLQKELEVLRDRRARSRLLVTTTFKAEVERSPLFLTLGPRPRKNRVVELTPVDVHVQTERSRKRTGGAEAIPAPQGQAAEPERLSRRGPAERIPAAPRALVPAVAQPNEAGVPVVAISRTTACGP